MEEGVCFLCMSKDCTPCQECRLVSSCSAHLSLHSYKNSCFPWMVQQVAGLGKVLVATRDIAPREVILHDQPFGLAPVQNSEPICLQCFQLLEAGSWFECQCGFPMCSKRCSEGDRHRLECRLYRDADAKMESLQEYQIIMPIRMLRQMEENQSWSSQFYNLMDHLEERKAETENWEISEVQVVAPIREKLKQEKWSADLIQRCLGVTRTNASQRSATQVYSKDKSNYSDVGTVRVLHLTMSLMSHSCIPNCVTLHNPDYTLTVRSMRPVKKGEELTISYTELLAGRLDRKRDTLHNWFFECSCERCLDVTDLGTNFDTHLCSACHGKVLPLDLGMNSQWKCESCHQLMNAKSIQDAESQLRFMLESGPQGNPIEFYENFLNSKPSRVHKDHSIMMKAKLKLFMAYENLTSRKELQRKCELGEELLALFNTILPGYSDIKGRILYEQSAPSFLLLQQDLESGSISIDQFSKRLHALSKKVEECVMCMEGGQEGSYEKYLEEKTNQILSSIKEMILFSHFL